MSVFLLKAIALANPKQINDVWLSSTNVRFKMVSLEVAATTLRS